MADKSTTVISLPQMVDLALNSPEVGIVNFTVLHSLLHVIVNQLDLGDCNVEFRGSDSERLQNYISTAKPGPIITLTEYTIGADGKGRKKRRGSKKTGKRGSVDEKGKKDEHQKEKEIAILKKDDDGSLDAESSGSLCQTIVVVEPASREKIGDSPKFTIALTKEQLTKLQKDIRDLQRKVGELTDMPANMGLIDALRSSGRDSGSNSPLLDMFQILTLVKRMDAMEAAMNKVATMLEDLAKDQSDLANVQSNLASAGFSGGKKGSISFKDPGSELVTKFQELRKSLDGTVGGAVQLNEVFGLIKGLEGRVRELEKSTKSLSTMAMAAGGMRGPSTDIRPVFSTSAPPSVQASIQGNVQGNVQGSVQGSIQGNIQGSSSDAPVSVTKPVVKKVTKQDSDDELNNEDEAEKTMAEGHSDISSADLSMLPPKEAIVVLQREVLNLKEQFARNNETGLEALKEVLMMKDTLLSGSDQKAMPPDVKIGQMDLRINDLKEQVSTLDTVYHQRFMNVQDKMEQLDKEISSLWERINLGLPGGDGSSSTTNHNLQEVYGKITQLQDEMMTLSETANKLLVEREGKQSTLDVMLEQIELLKTVKADREDLEDALADKADACQINRKVSHEQFDAAYDEITKTLEDTLDKLKKQEELWIQSLNDLQKEVGNKLDKMELTPLKDFINLKLKGIQEKVKKISALKQEHEAAGTKSKLLRNVNCISCDADVIMKKTTDITVFPKPYAMPASKSPGPYLAYELDLLRKQQKMLPTSKNLNMFESALQTGKNKNSDPDHICNRYCGGSHTVTTPQQRVMRVGHFMEQWGPEISPINEILIKGTDGHLYKGRDDAMLRALASEKAPTPRVESPAMVITEYNLKGEPSRDQKMDVRSETYNNVGSAVKMEAKISVSQDSAGRRPKSSVDKVETSKSSEASNKRQSKMDRSSGDINK